MTISDSTPRRLSKGANVGLRDLDTELGGVTVVLDTVAPDSGLDADVSVLLLGADGRVRSSDDLIFYNQPIALGGAVHLRDKIRAEPTSAQPGVLTSDLVTLELDDVPDDIERIVLSASLDEASHATFGSFTSLGMRVQRTSDAQDLLQFDLGGVDAETAMLFGEFYRRNGEWRVRAVGQGYSGGLVALVADHGVDVADPAQEGAEPVEDNEAIRPSTPEPPAPQTTLPPADDVDDAVAESPTSRTVSVRRPMRAPKFPQDWSASIPAEDGNDWQRARLFPVAGIGGKEEQERRGTSALLAVMGAVREFGRALTARCGAPFGALTTFVEVPFGQDEDAYRPDGVIRVTRGAKQWTALVEVKTSDGRLRDEQIDHYVDIARDRGFDAVITISNELTGAGLDHPVSVDRRKLKKVALVHIPWDRIRAEALLLARHRGVADVTQRWLLEEFLRYIDHPRSGMGGLGDMGPNWVKVRQGVKDKTARSHDKAVADVSGRYDQLVEHVALQLSGMLGVDVQATIPRSAPDNATRCQQLADSGLLFGCVKVPGAVDVVVIGVDLRADRVTASITVAAPRGETRPATRISWLLRHLPASASDSIRVEAQLAGGRGASTAALLGAVRQHPDSLIPADQREIRAFRISLDLPMGAKRAAGPGTLIGSVKTVTNTFYSDVVQHLRQWTPRST